MADSFLHRNDLPENISFGKTLGIDCEMMGLNLHRDRLCLLQLFDPESGAVHFVKFDGRDYSAPRLRALLQDKNRLFIGHMIRLDLGWILKYLQVMPENIYCTRTASRIARTYGASHDFKDLVTHLLDAHIDKSETTSDWGAETLTPAQLNYARNDVIFLPALKEKLDALLAREGRQQWMAGIMRTLPARVQMDVHGWWGEDILDFPFKN